MHQSVIGCLGVRWLEVCECGCHVSVSAYIECLLIVGLHVVHHSSPQPSLPVVDVQLLRPQPINERLQPLVAAIAELMQTVGQLAGQWVRREVAV